MSDFYFKNYSMLSACQDVDNIFVVIPVKNIMFKGAKVFPLVD